MTYRPEKRTARYVVISFLLFLLSSAAVFFASYLPFPPLYFLAFVIECFSFQIIIVYIISYYEYTVDDGVFSVYRVTGGKRVRIYDLDLRFCTGILPYAEAKKKIKSGAKPKKRYVCLLGMKRKNCCVLFYTDAKTPAVLYFSCDGIYYAIENYIRYAQS